jgi:hypothetical protein
MKLTSSVVAVAILAGTTWAQHASVAAHPSAPAQAKPVAASTQAHGVPAAKPAAATTVPAKAVPAKTTAATKPAPAQQKATVARPLPMVPANAAAKPQAAAAGETAAAKPEASAPSGDSDAAKSDAEDKKYSVTGKRDPFLSPVVSRASGSGCSTGKKCLDIEAIALHGVVRSDAGMIAVVTNGLNKAYFLRENDPVFNGYVVKITGDSVVFKETFQDRLGKPFTRDVVKKITTPAV